MTTAEAIEKQTEALVNKLEEIRCGLIDLEIKLEELNCKTVSLSSPTQNKERL